MSPFSFRSSYGSEIEPKEWLLWWAALYQGTDDPEHKRLTDKYESLSYEDFEQIGQWKDGAGTETSGGWKKNGNWKPNVASVAYQVWMKAASELPRCPDAAGVAGFLNYWSERTYTDVYHNGPRTKRFGLSRATTLLHFVSGGTLPIFDARVRRAMKQLLLNSSFPSTIRCYQDSYCPKFSELAKQCGTEDLRELDKALFSFDRFYVPPGKD